MVADDARQHRVRRLERQQMADQERSAIAVPDRGDATIGIDQPPHLVDMGADQRRAQLEGRPLGKRILPGTQAVEGRRGSSLLIIGPPPPPPPRGGGERAGTAATAAATSSLPAPQM